MDRLPASPHSTPDSEGPRVIHFTRQPATARTLFLFVPGLGGNMLQWRAVEDRLARHDVAVARLPPIRPHPGVESSRPLVEDLAAAAAQEIIDTDYRQVVVLAHSVGSFVGFELTVRVPDRVVGVVAVNGALYSVGRFLDRPLMELLRRPTFALAAARLALVATIPTNERFREFVLRRERLSRLIAGKLVPRDVMRSEDSRRVLSEGTNQRGILWGLWANRHHWPRFAANAERVTCPVVLVTGTLDPLTSVNDSNLMAGLFPSATVRILDGIGHSAPLQSPGAIVEIAERLAGLDHEAPGVG